MLDDTCYFIGFDDQVEAEGIFELLRRDKVKQFLDSLIFSDAKRSVTKDLLMRIDILSMMQQNKKVGDNDNIYLKIRKKISPNTQRKLALFG